ncbi:MAG: beta strand repeat-containing protein, partial [Akkermansia sp.]
GKNGTNGNDTAIRFGGDSTYDVKVSGDIQVADDAIFAASGTHSVISGSIIGANKTLTLTEFNGLGNEVRYNLTGATGKIINLGGLTVASLVTVNMNFASATVGNLTLSGAAFTNSGSLTIGGEGKTLTLGTELAGTSGTVDIKDSTTIKVTEDLFTSKAAIARDTNGFDVENVQSSSLIEGTVTYGTGITWKRGESSLTENNGLLTYTTTRYHIVDADVTWSEATGATALWVAENLTVTGGSSVPSTVTEFDISAGSTLSMDSLSGAKTVNGEGKLSVGTLSDTTTISGSGHIDITGDINLSGKSLTLKNSAAGSMVTLYGTNALRMIDMKTDGITAHLTLAAGSSTTLGYPTGNGIGLWMAANSTLDILKKDDDVSKEGGKLTFSSDTINATISATDQNASISSTGDKYTFDATSFTLTNAEFRANATSAAITLKNKLDNAIVVNDSTNNLTIENAANTLRGIQANNGNVVLAADTTVTGNRTIQVASNTQVQVNAGKTLKYEDFEYVGSTLSRSDTSASKAIALYDGAVTVSGGTLTQKANATDSNRNEIAKEVNAKLENVKFISESGMKTELKNTGNTYTGLSVAGELTLAAANVTVAEVILAGGSLTVGNNNTLTANQTLELATASGSTVSGNLTLANSAALKANVSGITAETSPALCTLNGALTLGSGLTLTLTNSDSFSGDLINLFSGVSSVTYTLPTTGGDAEVVALSEGTTAYLDSNGVDAHDIFNNVDAGTYTLKFENNMVSLVAQKDTPEPTTATLSLLALMGLAARRRRKA